MANSRNTVPVDTLTSWVRGEIEKYIADATHFHKDTPGAQDFLDKLTEYAGSAPDYDDVGFFFQDAVGDSCVGAWVKYDATMEQLQDSVADSRRIQALQEENRDVFSAFREAILDYLLGDLPETLTEAFQRDFGVSPEYEEVVIEGGGGHLV